MGSLGPFEENTIVVGDCRDVMAQMPDGCVDMTFADPPYLEVWPPGWITEAQRITKGTLLITPGIQNVAHLPPPNWICAWIKKNAKARTQCGFNCWEPIYVYRWPLKPNLRDTYEYPMGGKEDNAIGRFHPYPKAIRLVTALIKDFSLESDLIFDPFMGSGTTAVVADRLGRKFFGCDINPDYVKMALERLEKDRAGRQLQLL